MAAAEKIDTAVGYSGSEALAAARRHLVQPWPYAGQIGDEARGLVGDGDGIYIHDA